MPAILVLCQRYNTILTPIPAWTSLSSVAPGIFHFSAVGGKGYAERTRINAKKKKINNNNNNICVQCSGIQRFLLQPFIQSLEMDLPDPRTFPASLEHLPFVRRWHSSPAHCSVVSACCRTLAELCHQTPSCTGDRGTTPGSYACLLFEAAEK